MDSGQEHIRHFYTEYIDHLLTKRLELESEMALYNYHKELIIMTNDDPKIYQEDDHPLLEVQNLLCVIRSVRKMISMFQVKIRQAYAEYYKKIDIDTY